MKNQQMKKIAATALVAFGINLMPAPVFAVSTNIVSETKGKTTLTMSQIQDLAVIYNRNNESFALQQDMLDLSKTTTRNSRKTLQDTINSTSASTSGSSDSLAQLKQQLDNMSSDPTIVDTPGYLALQMQYQSAVSSMTSAKAQINSSIDTMIDQIETINDALDDLDDSEDDLKKSLSDWQNEVRLVAEKLCISYTQLEETIDLTKQQITLAEKAVNIAKIQQQLGTAITTDLVSAQNSLSEAQNSLASLEENLTMLKRQINLLIGRNMDSPLEITNVVGLPLAIEPAPTCTEKLIKQFIDANYELKTLERTKQNQRDVDVKNLSSDERKEVDQKVKSTELQITSQKETLENNLKSLLATINADGQSYQVARDNYANEQKIFEFNQLKYEQGLISQLEYMQAELTLNSAKLKMMQAGYTYYMDWQKYNALEQGITLTMYDSI